MTKVTDDSSYKRAGGIAAALIFAALVILVLSDAIAAEHPTVKHVIRDVGVALIVAAVVILTIEQRSRDELRHMVSRFLRGTHENLFQTILGVEFPKPMFDFVRDRLMKEPVFRTDTEVHYTIRPLAETVGKRWGIDTILLDMTFSYRIKNLSDREQLHPIRFFVEEPLGKGGEREALPRLLVDGKDISQEEMKHANEAWADRPGIKRFEYDLPMAPKEERFVQLHHQIVKLVADTECWRTLHPCDGLRFSITHPPELSVGVDAMHPDDLLIVRENEVSFIGQISRPLFPANGILFWWHPSEDDSPQANDSIAEIVVNPGGT